MGSTAKVRFVVDYNGQPRQLFSVEERSSGDLIIPIKHEEREGGPNDPSRPFIREQRLSVHYSPASPGTTIKRHNILSDQTVATNVAFIRDSKTDLLASLWTKAGPEPIERYALKARPKDTIVKIGGFRAEHSCTLVYSVFVGDNNKHWPAITGAALETHRFRRFTLAVYSTFLNWPAVQFAIIQMVATSPEQVNGVAKGPTIGDGMESIRSEDLGEFTFRQIKIASAMLLHKLGDDPAVGPHVGQLAKEWSMWFYATAEDAVIGEQQRLYDLMNGGAGVPFGHPQPSR